LSLLLGACSEDTPSEGTAALPATPVTPATTSTPTPSGAARVDAARLINADAEPGQWMSTGRTYGEQHFSPLDQINRSNVGSLGLAWYADFNIPRGQESTPLVVDGVIYVTTAWSNVLAFDAATGEEL